MLAGAFLLAACSPSGSAPRPVTSPSPSASPTAPPIAVGPPADRILAGPQAGLAVTGGRDHLDLTEAASEQQNQPLALTTYRSWGWVDEASRSWGSPAMHLEEALLLVTEEQGARQAFADLARTKVANPRPCPPLGFDDCAEDGSVLVARSGVYLVVLTGKGVDLEAEARLQAERLRS